MKEANITTMFSKKNKIVGCFELKLCKTKSIRFDSVKPHQIKALQNVASETGLYHKINDAPIFAGMKTRFTSQKPFDCFYLKNIPAYIVVCFYIPRKQKNCYYITPQEWMIKEIASDKKSIREEELAPSATHTLRL